MAKRKTPSTNSVSEPQAEYVRRTPSKARTHGVEPLAASLSKAAKTMPAQRFRALTKGMPLDTRQWSRLMHVPTTEWSTRQTRKQPLAPLEAERALQLVALFTKGADTFGDMASFRSWLDHPHFLYGEPPMELLVTGEGILEVMAELHRIDHGIPL